MLSDVNGGPKTTRSAIEAKVPAKYQKMSFRRRLKLDNGTLGSISHVCKVIKDFLACKIQFGDIQSPDHLCSDLSHSLVGRFSYSDQSCEGFGQF